MIYNYSQYHEKGNKYVYACGAFGTSLQFASLILANNITEAKELAKAHCRAWTIENGGFLSEYSITDCLKELARRNNKTVEQIKKIIIEEF